MESKNIIECNSCGHKFYADHPWVEQFAPGSTYPSAISIHTFLMSIKKDLKCSECGEKDISIDLKLPKFKPKAPAQIAEHEKRFVDEGLVGTREDHKRMRGQQMPYGYKKKR